MEHLDCWRIDGCFSFVYDRFPAGQEVGRVRRGGSWVGCVVPIFGFLVVDFFNLEYACGTFYREDSGRSDVDGDMDESEWRGEEGGGKCDRLREILLPGEARSTSSRAVNTISQTLFLPTPSPHFIVPGEGEHTFFFEL
ncbi:hypothetical protein Hypma_003940 [Hypsizygus marmoreus]|uniref:Uncharacterized protein n=1 Tax=Hypsizygus marmoreus TaxID=39966 RepID=A0A369J2W0_HYPMA|nr:hypothetical protein Hypma_003940 [Hypsizygus marmoreus]